MKTWQIEIDAPVIITVEAETAEIAEGLGNAAYSYVYERMAKAIAEFAAESGGADIQLGNRYDNTEVMEITDEPIHASALL